VIGTFPSLNQRSTAGYEEWLSEIEETLRGDTPARHGVNLIVHKTNERLEADLEITVRHRAPLVITSLCAAREVGWNVHQSNGHQRANWKISAVSAFSRAHVKQIGIPIEGAS
jgi:nitronate monooxygenase